MAYATVEDVRNYFLNYQFSANADLSTAKIQFHLDNEQSFIDLEISKVANLPITDTTDLKLLRQIHSKLVAGIVDEMTLNNDPKTGVELPKKRNLRKQAIQMLSDIVHRKVYLNSNSKTLITDGKEDLRYENLPICKSNALPDNPDCDNGCNYESCECEY